MYKGGHDASEDKERNKKQMLGARNIYFYAETKSERMYNTKLWNKFNTSNLNVQFLFSELSGNDG